MRLAGLLLAGGAGSRMGGETPKPLLEVGGTSIAAHVLERLAPHCDTILVSANDEAAFRLLGLPVVGDLRPGRAGPLAGLEAAAAFLAGREDAPTHLVCLPGDTPFLPKDVVAWLAGGADEGPRVARFAGRLHPTAALWPLAALARLPAHLDSGTAGRSIRAFLETTGFAPVDFPASETAPGGDPFFNVNTPDELAAARRCMKG